MSSSSLPVRSFETDVPSPFGRIAVGCGPTAGAFVSADATERTALVQAALDHGMRLFDTAPIYGDGTSETNLGSTLRALGSAAAISSKVFFQEVDEELATPEPDGFARRSVRASLERLGRDHLDYLFMHNRVALATSQPRGRRGPGPEIGLDELLQPGGIGARLEALKSDGLVDRIGLTGMGSEPQAILEALRSKRFDCLTYDVNPASVSAALTAAPGSVTLLDIAAEATQLGIPLIALRVLAKTTFIGTLPPWEEIAARYPGIDTAGSPSARDLWVTCQERDFSYSQFATVFVLSLPWVSMMLGGFSVVDHLEEAVDARSLVESLVESPVEN